MTAFVYLQTYVHIFSVIRKQLTTFGCLYRYVHILSVIRKRMTTFVYLYRYVHIFSVIRKTNDRTVIRKTNGRTVIRKTNAGPLAQDVLDLLLVPAVVLFPIGVTKRAPREVSGAPWAAKSFFLMQRGPPGGCKKWFIARAV